MDGKELIPGSLMKYPDGRIFQIRELAKNRETGETMVVYQDMQPPFQVWVSALHSGKDKTQQTGQETQQSKPETQQQSEMGVQQSKQEQQITRQFGQAASQPGQSEQRSGRTGQANVLSEEEFKKAMINGHVQQLLKEQMDEKEVAKRGFLAILDAETFREKRQLFMVLKPYLTELDLSNLAVALDIVLKGTEKEVCYDEILHCLETFERYEGGRLRP